MINEMTLCNAADVLLRNLETKQFELTVFLIVQPLPSVVIAIDRKYGSAKPGFLCPVIQDCAAGQVESSFFKERHPLGSPGGDILVKMCCCSHRFAEYIHKYECKVDSPYRHPRRK